MESTFAVSLSKWAMTLATKFIQADLRLHNAGYVKDDMSIIFAVNHFTRIETLLLPYAINKYTGREVWSLAAAELFNGKIGSYLQSMGTVSTKAPDRDKIIIGNLLSGNHPWIIFPEGAMIKDKKVVDKTGKFCLNYDGNPRGPRTGAAVLALRSEFYRQQFIKMTECGNEEGIKALQNQFDLEDVEKVLSRRTVIIPVNVTYFPIRSFENIFLRMAKSYAKDLSTRAIEELSVEGTVLSRDTDIDITFGEPVPILDKLQNPDFSAVLEQQQCEFDEEENDSRSLIYQAAQETTQEVMRTVYSLTTINYDHIFATIMRYQGVESFTERAYRNRIFLCAHELNIKGKYRLHGLLKEYYRSIVYEDPSPKFHDFIQQCMNEEIITTDGKFYTRNPKTERDLSDFQTIRWKEMTYVVANEIEPLPDVVDLIKNMSKMPSFLLSKRIRDIFIKEDQQNFERDYAFHYNAELSKPPDVGRPFLLKPENPKGGVILSHGYMSAPLEVRALAEDLYQRGYAVYGVRLKGHGTAPLDLAETKWEDWYESLNRGYAIIKSLTDNIILGGFSTGGTLTMLAAARKGMKINAAFSICAPLQLRNYGSLLAPSVMSIKSLLKRFGKETSQWDFVESEPENEHINYTKNPISGIDELMKLMYETEHSLKNVQAPCLVIQSSGDPTVTPVSAQLIFDSLGTKEKELALISSDRHGIINGEGKKKVFERVAHFLEMLPKREVAQELDVHSKIV